MLDYTRYTTVENFLSGNALSGAHVDVMGRTRQTVRGDKPDAKTLYLVGDGNFARLFTSYPEIEELLRNSTRTNHSVRVQGIARLAEDGYDIEVEGMYIIFNAAKHDDVSAYVHGSLEEISRIAIQSALMHTGGNKTAAANMLRISRRSLYRALDRLDIPRKKRVKSPTSHS